MDIESDKKTSERSKSCDGTTSELNDPTVENILVDSEKWTELKKRCSPNQITELCLINSKTKKKNPFDYCLALIKEIRDEKIYGTSPDSDYDKLINDVEKYMCTLLDQVDEMEDLQEILGWSFNTKKKDQFDIVDKAIQKKLKTFVSHRHIQNVFSLIRHQQISNLKDKRPWKVWIINQGYGFFYFFWPILICLSPWKKIKDLLKKPVILYECHFMAEMMFLLLLILNTVTKNLATDVLGAPPTVIEWFILIFILGMISREVVERKHRGKEYFKDYWNYLDLAFLFCFSVAILLRVADVILHLNSSAQINKLSWKDSEPRLLSTGFLAFGYILALFRLLSYTRNNKFLGPQLIALAKMIVNIIQFVTFFLLLLFSFSLSLTELYWQDGTPDGIFEICGNTSQYQGSCKVAVSFATVGGSLKELFWSIFGYLDFNNLLVFTPNSFDSYIAIQLLAIYHVSVIIVLINMLIAMMTQSFDDTNENRVEEWKFHRTALWIRFLRSDVSRPPPMNLVPKIHLIFLWIKGNSHKIDKADRKKKKWNVFEKLLKKLQNNTSSTSKKRNRFNKNSKTNSSLLILK